MPGSSGVRSVSPPQMLAGHCGELVGIPEGELAQENPQCRGRVRFVEHPGRAAGTQHVDIVNVVRAAHHGGDDRGQLAGRVDRTRGRFNWHQDLFAVSHNADAVSATVDVSPSISGAQSVCRHTPQSSGGSPQVGVAG